MRLIRQVYEWAYGRNIRGGQHRPRKNEAKTNIASSDISNAAAVAIKGDVCGIWRSANGLMKKGQNGGFQHAVNFIRVVKQENRKVVYTNTASRRVEVTAKWHCMLSFIILALKRECRVENTRKES